MPWTNWAKDRFFAPKLSQLSSCGAEPLQVDLVAADFWFANFLLNSALRFQYPDPARQLGVALLRRVDGALREYEAGRLQLSEYFTDAEGPHLTQYSRALLHFETCIALTYQSWMLARALLPNPPRLFAPNDGTDIARLNELYNASKHSDERIADGPYAPESTLPIWLVNDGIEGVRAHLSFNEFRLLLESLWRIASTVSNPASPTPSRSEPNDPDKV